MNGGSDTEALWRALHDQLSSFFRRRVRDPHTAEDLVQDTFVRVQRGLASVRDDERLGAWVQGVAGNVLAEHHRRARLPVEELLEHQEPARELAREDELNSLVAGWLPSFAEELPPDHRDALVLSELEGLPQREVAERLGLSLSGTKSRVQRGRRMLRAALARCCEVELDRRGNVLGYERRSDCAGCDD